VIKTANPFALLGSDSDWRTYVDNSAQRI
jgi:hypothetical protein